MKNLCRPNGASTFPLSFLDSNIPKVLAFSYTLVILKRLSRMTSTISIFHGISRKRFYLKDTTKTHQNHENF